MAFSQYLFFYEWPLLTVGHKFTCTKILFLQYPEVRIFTLVKKYSHETQIIQHLTHFGPTPDMEWLIHYQKKGILE